MPNKIKVLHFSPHAEASGIAKYQERYFDGMRDIPDIQNDFFDDTPTRTRFLSKGEYFVFVQSLKTKLKSYDILHIQHELAYYKGDQLGPLIRVAHDLHKPVIVSAHTAPDVEYKHPAFGISPQNFIKYLRAVRAANKFTETHLKPMREADLVLVHNKATRNSFVTHGVAADKIVVIPHPVYAVSFKAKSTEISEQLHQKPGDIIFGAIGFLSRTKGTMQAVKALTYLPENFKLAVIGGVHPGAGPDADEKFFDDVTDLVRRLDLKERVYITGYIEDDDKMDTLIRECDICVYPYDKKYYSFVSSGSINLAIANFKPVIAYPLPTLAEMNVDNGPICFTKSGTYYELARSITSVDTKQGIELSKAYAARYAWPKKAEELADIYRNIARTQAQK